MFTAEFMQRCLGASVEIERQNSYYYSMPAPATPEVLPDLEQEKQTDSSTDLEPGYLVICWNDPVNLMQYVTHVFQTVFGWNRKKAEKHMLEVHHHEIGRAH